MTEDYLKFLFSTFSDYFKQGGKIRLVHLIADSIIFNKNIASIHGKMSSHIFNINDISQPEKHISLLDMYPFQFKDGLIVKPLLSNQDLIEEGIKMGHCVGNLEYFYRVLKGESFLFHLENSFTKQESTLEIKYDSYNKFYINQNLGGETHKDAKYLLKKINQHINASIYQKFVGVACLKPESIKKVDEELKPNQYNYEFIKDFYKPYFLTLFKNIEKKFIFKIKIYHT